MTVHRDYGIVGRKRKRASSQDFGNRLKAIRLVRKLPQERFAELVGISVDFLSLIERGVNAPSF